MGSARLRLPAVRLQVRESTATPARSRMSLPLMHGQVWVAVLAAWQSVGPSRHPGVPLGAAKSGHQGVPACMVHVPAGTRCTGVVMLRKEPHQPQDRGAGGSARCPTVAVSPANCRGPWCTQPALPKIIPDFCRPPRARGAQAGVLTEGVKGSRVKAA